MKKIPELGESLEIVAKDPLKNPKILIYTKTIMPETSKSFTSI